MTNAASPADESTLTRSDVEWTPTWEKPCTCGACLVCEVESLAGDGKPLFTYPAEVN